MSLLWDLNPLEEKVAEYSVYERVQKETIHFGMVRTNRAVLLNVSAGFHCYVVTAHNGTGESEFSQEVCVSVPPEFAGGETRLDLTPPVGSIDPLPEDSPESILVRWFGQDDPGGSGLDAYDIFVSINDGPYQPWLLGTRLTGGVFAGLPGYHYDFYCVASDAAGNRSGGVPVSQARTRVPGVNHPPVVSPVPLVSARVGEAIVITNRVTDPEQAYQTLDFELCESSAGEAKVDPVSGLFYWTPRWADACRTNRFSICITDNGYPSLSVTQRLEVVVEHYLRVQLDSLVVYQQTNVLLPVRVESSAGSYAARFSIGTLASGVEVLGFEADPIQACAASARPEGNGRWKLDVQTCQPSPPPSAVMLGHLRLHITAPESAFLPLEVSGVSAAADGGCALPAASGRSGRIVFLRTRPLLEVNPVDAAGMALMLYGIQGQPHALEQRLGPVEGGAWQPLWQGDLTRVPRRFYVPFQGTQGSLRARQGPAL